MRNAWILMTATLAVLLAGGCADPVVVSEVLQLEQDQCVHTRYNIWYTNPMEISCLNIQQGSILPVGSQVEPLGTSYNHITGKSKVMFRDNAGQMYTLIFDPGYELGSLRDYIAKTFTARTAEEMFEDIEEAAVNRILEGQVVPGMSRREVLLSYGPPPPVRTPDLRYNTWTYWLTENDSIHVIFQGDKVRNVLNVND